MTDESRVQRAAKNTIFLDLFSIPKYSLEMLKALHPEMTDLTEDDVRAVTLNPVILNKGCRILAALIVSKTA